MARFMTPIYLEMDAPTATAARKETAKLAALLNSSGEGCAYVDDADPTLPVLGAFDDTDIEEITYHLVHADDGAPTALAPLHAGTRGEVLDLLGYRLVAKVLPYDTSAHASGPGAPAAAIADPLSLSSED